MKKKFDAGGIFYFDEATNEIKVTSIEFPGGTTQKRGVRGPSVSIDDFGAFPLGQFETTCNATNGSNVVEFGTVSGLQVGMEVSIQGAGGANGYGGFLWFNAKITNINGVNLTLDANVTRTVVGAVARQDNSASIQAAIDSFPVGGPPGILWASPGTYFCNSTIRMRRRGLEFRGESREATTLLFATGVTGIIIVSSYSPDAAGEYGDYSITSDLTLNSTVPSSWSGMLNLASDYYYPVVPNVVVTGLVYVAVRADGATGSVEPVWPTTAGDTVEDDGVTWLAVKADGITCYSSSYIVRIREHGFGGDGCFVYGDPSGTPNSNSDLFRAEDCKFYTNQGHGFHVLGGAANAGQAYNVSCGYNGGYGFRDESDLGNLYSGCHTEQNIQGSYRASGLNGPCTFINCYSEGGQEAKTTGCGHVFIGGALQFANDDEGVYIGFGFFRNGATFSKRAASGRDLEVSISKNGSNDYFLRFIYPDTADDNNFADGGGTPSGWTASYNALCGANTAGSTIAIPFGRGHMRDIGMAVARGLQIGKLNESNLRIFVDAATMTNGQRWLQGWECRNVSGIVGQPYTTHCIRSGRAWPKWVANTAYTAGDRIRTTVDGRDGYDAFYFTCTQSGTSDLTTEPTWSTAAGGVEITDGTAKWKIGDVNVPVWQATTAYAAGDIVRTSNGLESGACFEYRCVKAGTSGSNEPTWSPRDVAPTTDNDVIWLSDNEPLYSASFVTTGTIGT